MLANDRDTDGTLDATSVKIVSPPASGKAVVNPNGTITYTPGTNLGNITFTYTVKDDLGRSPVRRPSRCKSTPCR